jgi:hypothetical protein
VALLGIAFSIGVEPESFSSGVVLFWVTVGMFMSAGFWLLPLALRQRGRISGGARVLCLILQIPVLYFAGSVALHKLNQAIRFGHLLAIDDGITMFGALAFVALSLYTMLRVLRAESEGAD